MSSYFIEIENAIFVGDGYEKIQFQNYKASVLMPVNAGQGLFNTVGKLNYGRYANSGFVQFFSHILENKVLVLGGSIIDISNYNITRQRRYLSSLVGEQVLAKITVYDPDNFEETKEFFYTKGVIESLGQVSIVNSLTENVSLNLFCETPYFFKYETLDGNGNPNLITISRTIQETGYYYDFYYPKVYDDVAGPLIINNEGNSVAFPVIELKNLSQNWIISNNGKSAFFSGFVSEGETITIDTLNSTVISSTGQNRNQFFDGFENLYLQPGENKITTNLLQFGASTQIVYKYNHTFKSL